MKGLLFAALPITLGLALGTAALAHHAGEKRASGAIEVSHAWTQENAAMAHATEVYLTIANTGEEADRLLGGSAGFAGRVEIQAQVMGADGVLKTRSIEALEIAPGQTVTFQPGGTRLVLMNVQRQFRAGQHFDMDLTFEKAGPVEIEVEVEKIDHEGGAEPGA